MSSILNQTGDSTSAAGRPDFGKLLALGVITIDPTTNLPVGVAQTPEIGKKMITVRVDGVKTRKEIPVLGGHAKNPDMPAWRAGLTPEKYHAKVLKEAELKAAGRDVQVAPDLTPDEAESYLNWLTQSGIDTVDDSSLQPIEEAKTEVIAKTIAKAKKTVSKKK